MKYLFLLFYCFIYCFLYTTAQEDVQYRVLLIGDAGEINPAQQAILNDAVSKSIPGKTLALFLGDNIYPKGVELIPGKKETTLNILRSQYEGLRKNGIPVYFVPGNHDWDKSGPLGYEKIIAANAFFNAQPDSLLQIIPGDACPGPVEMRVTDNLVIVAMDSEWWLYPYDKQTDKSDCPCKTKRDVLGRLNDILQRNSNKTVIFATHHPFESHGTHGGFYTFKQHVFPLTDYKKNLYIPLPVIGSLYPVLRKSFPPAEDLGNVLYKDMKKSVDDILKTHPNVIHVAGHEHTLQLLQGAVLQVVSGAGCKQTPVKKGKGSLYATGSTGYVCADILNDNSLRLHYFIFNRGTIKESFVYNRPYMSPVLASASFDDNNITGDSIRIKLLPAFDKVSRIHRSMFGENYRKVWAMENIFPVLHLSATDLQPTELGGGMQTHSLRLEDKNKKEWVLRSVDKFPDALLPQVLNQTLASNILHDNVSAIFPYAPLAVPVFAAALGVPHSNPSIVYVAPDKRLGVYSRDFANKIFLLEEREPLGKSSSTIKMLQKLKDDNDNSVDQQAFLTARIQDIFLGDWDRHGDQWRWVDDETGKNKKYKPVPRDRDQVFYVNQGLFPAIVALPWIMPKFEGFGAHIRNINTFSFNARQIDGIFTNALTFEDWTKSTAHAVNALTDSVIETALQKMPVANDAVHKKLYEQLKKRRPDMLRVVPRYYRFLNKNIDITFSDKNEQVSITDTLDGKLNLVVFKITKNNGPGKLLYSRLVDPSVTKELHLYMYGGEDNINIVNNSSPVTIRIIGDGVARKQYHFAGRAKYLRKIHVYEGDSSAVFRGQTQPVRLHLSADADNTALMLTDRYNKTVPLLTAGFNVDDGLLLGAGIRWVKQGFRKTPYASTQQFIFGHSFSTAAFRLNYKGEWLHIIGKTDFALQANAFAPDNTQNFYGRGNSSGFDKTGNFKRFYRTRFDFYEINPSFRWRGSKGSSFSVGPSVQYYHMDADDNKGRFINNTSLLHSYDSSTVVNDKTHAGLIAAYIHDTRNNLLLPFAGNYINLKLKGYSGLNGYSKSYVQLVAVVAVYKNLDRKSNFIIANRTGGGITAGKAAFYQSLFLGGQDNLQGYRQFRFAGEHMVYNNFEARIKLANLASYLVPGQLGLVGFYDVGKVWQKGYNDNIWHQGAGAGLYFAPAQMLVVQLVAGKSEEGWYPYFTMGFRF